MNQSDELGSMPNEANSERSQVHTTNRIKLCHLNILGAGELGPPSSANIKLDQIRTELQLYHGFDVI